MFLLTCDKHDFLNTGKAKKPNLSDILKTDPSKNMQFFRELFYRLFPRVGVSLSHL